MTSSTNPAEQISEEAVDAAAKAVVMAQSNGCCDEWPKPCDECDCFRTENPIMMAAYERSHAHVALAAALPALRARIETEDRAKVKAVEKLLRIYERAADFDPTGEFWKRAIDLRAALGKGGQP